MGGRAALWPCQPLAELTDAEQARVERIAAFMSDEFGYAQIQSTRPQTLSYGLTDSFAAMDAPDLLVGDVRAFFRRFR